MCIYTLISNTLTLEKTTKSNPTCISSRYVDRSKEYKAVTLACLSATLGLLILLGFAFGFKLHMPSWVVVGSIFMLGMVGGPIQPVNAELAVEVTHISTKTHTHTYMRHLKSCYSSYYFYFYFYNAEHTLIICAFQYRPFASIKSKVSYPEDETSIASLQQLVGNLFSAVLVPICEKASEFDFASIPGFSDASEVYLVLRKRKIIFVDQTFMLLDENNLCYFGRCSISVIIELDFSTRTYYNYIMVTHIHEYVCRI
jgi:hypothetical protein